MRPVLILLSPSISKLVMIIPTWGCLPLSYKIFGSSISCSSLTEQSIISQLSILVDIQHRKHEVIHDVFCLPRSRRLWNAPEEKYIADYTTSGNNSFTDLDVVQSGLSLYHIELAFYGQGLSNFSAEHFANARYPPEIRERYLQIVANEQYHVETLSAILVAAGVLPVSLCTYAFPITTLEEFIETTHAFENAASSLWNYASAAIVDPTIATLAGGILSTKGRHAAWIGTTLFHENTWNAHFETPLNFRQIYSSAKAFIVSCPEYQPNILGYSDTFPSLKVTVNHPSATFDFEALAGSTQPFYTAFLNGNGPSGNNSSQTFAPIDKVTGAVVIPPGLKGYTYALVTSENGVVSDDVTVAGLAIPNSNVAFGFGYTELELA